MLCDEGDGRADKESEEACEEECEGWSGNTRFNKLPLRFLGESPRGLALNDDSVFETAAH